MVGVYLMSVYNLAPSPSFAEHIFSTWNDGFSDEDIANIIAIAESRGIERAAIGNGETNAPEYRKSNVAWIDLREDSQWLYDKIGYILRMLNGQFYRFDISGFNEHLQFTVYDGSEGGHYDWHIDSGKAGEVPRKLSFVLQLSDPSEYEGGELQIMASKNIDVVDKKKGLAVVFPSYTLHRVTPVTSGVRKTLVVWFTGSAFR